MSCVRIVDDISQETVSHPSELRWCSKPARLPRRPPGFKPSCEKHGHKVYKLGSQHCGLCIITLARMITWYDGAISWHRGDVKDPPWTEDNIHNRTLAEVGRHQPMERKVKIRCHNDLSLTAEMPTVSLTLRSRWCDLTVVCWWQVCGPSWPRATVCSTWTSAAVCSSTLQCCHLVWLTATGDKETLTHWQCTLEVGINESSSCAIGVRTIHLLTMFATFLHFFNWNQRN